MTHSEDTPDSPATAPPPSARSTADGALPEGTTDDERWLVVRGRRWRRTDPSLPSALVAALTSHLGRGRAGVRVAKSSGDDEQVAAARRRVGLAKAGLGERGPRWWEEPEEERLGRAQDALRSLDALDAEGADPAPGDLGTDGTDGTDD